MKKISVLITFLLLFLGTSKAQVVKEMRFENTKLETILKAISQVSGMSVMFDPNISQDLQKTVSISVYRPIRVQEVMNIILKEYKLIAVPVDTKVYKITRAGEITISTAGLTDAQANQLVNSLKTRLTPSAEIVIDKTLGTIYIRDEEESIKKLDPIIKDFKTFVERVAPTQVVERETKVFYLKNISLDEALSILNRYKTPDTVITRVDGFNALVITDTPEKLKSYEKLFSNFLTDRPKERRPITKIFYLRYISPEEFIRLIEPLRSEAGVILSGGAFVQQQAQPTGQQQMAQQQATQVQTPILREFNAVMITDFPEVIDKIRERFSEYISDAPIRVLIEARIVEANKEVTRQLGISFNLNISNARVPEVWQGGIGSNVGVGPLPPWWFNPGPSPTPGSIAVFSYQKGVLNALNIRLAAYERVNLVRNLAKPSITTINGQKATIKQGLEIPYRTSAVGGGGTAIPTIQFKEVVLQLDVTPIVSPDGRVLLDINIKRDLPVSLAQEPPLSKSEVSTKLIVEDGQTVVIGGIVDSNRTNTNEGLPGVARVPLLKWLLGQETISSQDKELLVFITPIVISR